MMNRIIQRVERDEEWVAMNAASRPPPEPSSPDAIAAAARQVANTIGAKAIVAFTNSGSTALRVARQRPEQRVLGVTPFLATARRLAMVSGVHAVVTELTRTMTETVARAVEVVRRERAATLGEEIVVTAGVPVGQSGTTNALRVARVERTTPTDEAG
jgi:pyruvate kinase